MATVLHLPLTRTPIATLFPVTFFAVTSLGAIATTANPLYTELSHQISEPKLIITVDQLLPKFTQFNLSILDLHNYSDLIAKSHNLTVISPYVFQNDVAVILYSSGITGLG
ncbi:hypothetical protein SSX86_007954 [Deinandra increscens subsp. villosa]|uniref:AMP-dependent synthetase/ligase domain-containing protein n=1 Tax=Deinandra increscens subsp. villosa TaxID=3103831 RepID=A0AAP0DEE1_9ASTR